MIKDKIKKYIFRKMNVSFSVSGEDVLLNQLLKKNLNLDNLYVDIGCHDPIINSNSYYFYLRGWKGICIDPNPIFINSFLKHRPNDTFINCGISDKNEKLDYFMHSNEHSDLNTFNPKNVKSKYFYKKISLRLNTLEKTLDKILKKKQNRIGFMSIDVEGYDLKVLKSNDWDRYRPSVVVVEFNGNMLDVYKSPIYEYLNDLSYEPVSKTSTNINFGNLFFIDKKIKWNL